VNAVDFLKKAYKFIIEWEERLAGITLVASVLVVMAGAVGRIIGYPLGWSMDMATFLFAWTVFFAADAAWRDNKHVSLDILVRLLPKRAQLIVHMCNHVIIGIFLALLIRYGISMSWITRFRTYQGIPGFSYTWATITVPIGSTLLLITAVLKLRDLIAEYRAARADTVDPKQSIQG
jgi:TRAP-type C4-dicarboxylate transport system permease small subunit